MWWWGGRFYLSYMKYTIISVQACLHLLPDISFSLFLMSELLFYPMSVFTWTLPVSDLSSCPQKLSSTFWIIFFRYLFDHMGGSVVKNPPANAGITGDACWIPGSGRSPGGGNGNPLQYSCLGNPMDRGTWQAADRGVAKSRTQLSAHTHALLRNVPSLPRGKQDWS